MNKLIKIFTVTLLFVLAGCQQAHNAKKISFLSIEMPEGVIHAKKMDNKNIVDSDRVSMGLYRPPANVIEIIKSAEAKEGVSLFRDVDVVFQTPFCFVPLVCIGTDKFVTVDEQLKVAKE